MGDAERPPTPNPRDRIRPGARGVPATLADGATWLLARPGLDRDLDDIRDRMFDDLALTGTVGVGDATWLGLILLLMNYDLTRAEAVALLRDVEPAPLADAVLAALFGDVERPRTYSRWARASLHANGIDPGTIPPEELPDVLDLLVATRRAFPLAEYSEAAEAAKKLDEARQMARRYAAATGGPTP